MGWDISGSRLFSAITRRLIEISKFRWSSRKVERHYLHVRLCGIGKTQSYDWLFMAELFLNLLFTANTPLAYPPYAHLDATLRYVFFGIIDQQLIMTTFLLTLFPASASLIVVWILLLQGIKKMHFYIVAWWCTMICRIKQPLWAALEWIRRVTELCQTHINEIKH